MATTTFRERMERPGPKRLLALDGGGIRGLISIEILARLETLLRDATGDERLVLGDWFDYVAGTSTGAILATCVALGLSTERMREYYLAAGSRIFERAPFWRLWYERHVATGLVATLRQILVTTDGRERLLGDDDLRTLLLVVMANATTRSPWPISNNPQARYNSREHPGCNLDIPLWKLIRASTAAPVYFPPEVIAVGGRPFTFVDGAVTVYNNPAFILFLMATLPEYRLRWETGEDKLLLVSVGTGVLSAEEKHLHPGRMGLLYNAAAVPAALIDAALNEQDLLCRIFGRCRFGDPIDREVGDLIITDDRAAELDAGAFAPKKFSYARYNPMLTDDGLAALGLAGLRARDVQPLDSAKHMPELMAVGKAYARRLDLAHLGPFDPRRR